jgi:hypothetical protein
MPNDRGQYGPPLIAPRVGADAPSSGRSAIPWIIGGGLAVVGLAVFGAHAASQRPRLTAHEKEIREWEAEFPGLPWYMDQVKDARQLDTWERARDYWERTH